MELHQALDVLGENRSKAILQDMFSTLLTLNAQGRGQRYPVTVKGQLVKRWRHEVTNTAAELAHGAYKILRRHGFDKPELWVDEIYMAKVPGNNDLVVSDLIDALREQRAERVVDTIIRTGLRPGAKILDYGVGSGRIALRLAAERPDLIIHGIDVHSYASPKLPQYTHFTDPAQIKENEYDLVLAAWMFHHADKKDHETILGTIRGALKEEGGRFLMLETVVDSPFSHENREPYTLRTAAAVLKDAVSSNGFIPGRPYTGTKISGYEPASHWQRLLDEKGFISEGPVMHMAAENDEFCEYTLLTQCRALPPAARPRVTLVGASPSGDRESSPEAVL